MKITELGLAAFIKARGYILVGCEGKTFFFIGEEGVKRELEIAYANSCCRQHDSTVMYLRSMIAKTHRTKG
jgi:hypothetical protein